MANLEEEDQAVVVTVIENMICDEVKLVNQERPWECDCEGHNDLYKGYI